MIPFLPGSRRRRADTDGHVRARTLLAERIEAELQDSDAAWLEAHLITCEDCAAAGTAYAEQRELLRSLAAPVPPRDLWARTSAKIELESGGTAGRRGSRRSVVPLGALSGALVVAVVVGASLLSQPTVTPVDTGSPSPIASSAAVSPEPRATPIAVGAGDVGWALQNDDGSYAITFAPIDEVCGTDIQPDCAPLDPPVASTIRLSAEPRAIVKSPTQDQLVVVEASTRSGGGTVYVLPVPSPEPSVEPSLAPSPSVGPTGGSSPTPTPPASGKPSPTPSPATTPTPTRTPRPTPTPTASPSPVVTPSPSVEPSPTASPEASTEPSMAPSPSPSPGGDPSGGGDTSGPEPIAIAADVIVVGESAAYSSNGDWFAFAARPADGSEGPDIFVWQPGDPNARPVTTDHRSVFSAWVGDRILGSRVVEPVIDAPADASPPPATTVSFLLDPATGEEMILRDLRIWRPVVDPTSRFVIFWDGSIKVDEAGLDWHPGEGRLVLARWDPALAYGDPVSQMEPPATLEPEPSGELTPSGEPTPSEPGPSPSPITAVLAILSDGVVRDWEVHWDETGTRFALWVADPVDPDVGSISLHEVDPVTGTLDADGPVLPGVPALAGFSMGDGRLAWATPPGQGGEGSRIVVLAWRGSEAGRIESTPDKGSAPFVVIK